jgi:transcriptional antiterminator NusG
MFCVIPAIYFRDVAELKHVHGNPMELSRLDIDGIPARNIKRKDGTTLRAPAVPGLKDFKEAVEAEYAATERLRDLGEWECKYRPGQALEIMSGPFEGFPGKFVKTIKDAYHGHPMLQLHVEIFGRQTRIDVAPDAVSC